LKDWHRTSAVGIKCKSINTYRRRIQPVFTTIDVSPGENYRWLEPDEFVEPTDQVFRPDLNPMWIPPLTRAGYQCGDDNYPVRRSIARTVAAPVESPDSDPPPFAKPFTNPRSGMGIRKDPVESPDDWCEITDDEHVLRKYVDFVKSEGINQPITQWEGCKVGHCSRWPIFCRRKNLPVQNPCTRRIDTEGRDVTKENGLHDESDRIVKRVPVRLFLDDRNNVFAVRGEWPIVVGTQIKHDADGFYIEVQP